MRRVHEVTPVRVGLGGDMHLPQSAVDFLRLRTLDFVHIVQWDDGTIEVVAATCPAHAHHYKKDGPEKPSKMDLLTSDDAPTKRE